MRAKNKAYEGSGRKICGKSEGLSVAAERLLKSHLPLAKRAHGQDL
mgnify:CR=1 FL=1